jgi:hypothetical protein
VLSLHSLDPTRVQLRLHVHVPAAASRADEALTSLRDRRLEWEAQLRGRNITLTTAGIAVDSGKLTIAVKIGEGHSFGYVCHERS